MIGYSMGTAQTIAGLMANKAPLYLTLNDSSFTYGPGTENFGGIYENTAIFDKIVYSFNLKMKTSRTDLKPTGLKVLLMKKCFAIFAAAVILTACGGGGGPKSIVDSLPDNFTPPGNSTTPVVRDTVPDTSAAEN